jgi:hypothetical protein
MRGGGHEAGLFGGLAWHKISLHQRGKTMTPYVNTSKKMSKRLFDALTLHEFSCAAKNTQSVTEESVRQFLEQRFDKKLADQFSPDCLLIGQASSSHLP